MSRRVLQPFLALLLLWPSGSVLVAAAWVLPHKSSSRISSTPTVTPRVPPLLLRATQQRRNHQSSTVLLFAGGGFGGSGGASAAAAKNKELKLKPKQQWDRYTTALKKERSVKVGVKVVVADSSNSNSIIDWLEVGAVKSAPGTATEIAVARQRALIVEVCDGLFVR